MTSTLILSLQRDGSRVNLIAKRGDTVVAFLDEVSEIMDLLDEAAARDEGVFCSSDLDFPEEITSDPHVISLCRFLRG